VASARGFSQPTAAHANLNSGVTLCPEVVNLNQRRLGNSELHVSEIGLGCNNFGYVKALDVNETRRIVHRAFDCGINFLDTSDSYGHSEEFLGQVLGSHRSRIVLATKFGSQLDPEGKKKGASQRYIFSAVEVSLSRLKTEWIDLYQLHRPDPGTPIEETLRALNTLVEQGKVRYIGCSNFSAEQLVEAHETAERLGLKQFVTSQDEYSLLVRNIETDLLPAVERFGMSELPYFPLASGLLTGKYKRQEEHPADSRLAQKPALSQKYATTENFDKVEKLSAFATRRGHTLLELAFSWLLSHKEVGSVIAGATKPEQVEANSKAGSWKLSPDELAAVDSITRP
jgi:aryl-alcohol dehydrogenase-like predicted oxidoreductase